MNFDYLGALRAGASPEDIAEYLSKERGYNLEGALKAGAPIMGVVEYLSKERPLSERLMQAGKEGVENTITAGKLAATYSPEETASLISEAAKKQTPMNMVQRQMAEEIAPYQKAYEESSGLGAILPFGQLAGKRAMQFAQNPEELTVSTVQNLPQSVPGIVGGLAGAGTGGALGSVVPGAGTVAGAITGGVLGGTLGAYPIEQGSAMQDLILQEARKRDIDPTNVEALKPLVKEKYDEFLKQSRVKGAGTAVTDAALNVATLGIAGAGERSLLKEIDALTAAKQAGQISAKDYASQLAEVQAKQEARNTLASKTLRGLGVTAGEMAGEGISEGVGQELAYGKVDPLSVIDESILGLGQGTGMSASRNILNKVAGQATNDAVDTALNQARTLLPKEVAPEQETTDEVIGTTPYLRDIETQDRLDELERAKKEQELVEQDEDIGTKAASGVSFTTAKGSTYQVNDNGTTTRNKSYHPEHGIEDQGEQPTSHQTVYVDRAGLNKLGMFQGTAPEGLVHQLVTNNGVAAVRQVDATTGQATPEYQQSVTQVHSEPAVGLYPVEIWNNGGTVHFGNKITGVSNAPAKTIEPAGTAGSPSGDLGSSGAGVGSSDTGAPVVAERPPVGTTGGATNETVLGAGELNAPLAPAYTPKAGKEQSAYDRLIEQRNADLNDEYTTVYNDFADDLIKSHGGTRQDFEGTNALHSRMVAKVLDDFKDAIKELKSTETSVQNIAKPNKEEKESLRAAQINKDAIKQYLVAMGVPENITQHLENNPKDITPTVSSFTAHSREDEKRIAAERKERPPRNEFLDMLEAFTPGKNYYGTGEEHALYEQAKQDAKQKGVESTQEKALKNYSDEDLKQLRGITKFKYMTLPENAPESYSDSVANSLRRIEREIASRAGTLDETVPYELPVGRDYGAPLQGAAKAAVDKGNLQGAIKSLAGAHPDKQIGDMLRRVANLTSGVKLAKGKPSDTEAGRYDAATNTVTLHPVHGNKEHVVLHEGVHAALAKTLANVSHPVTQEFTEFFNEVKTQLGTEYGGNDLQEFAAEFLSNEHFQGLLKNIQTPKKQSMFGAIIDAIARMLGFNKNTSAYDTAIKHLNKALDLAINEKYNPMVQTTQGMGAAVTEGFRDLGDALKYANRVPKNVLNSAEQTISKAATGGMQKLLMNAISLNNMADMLSKRLGDVPASVREMSTIMGEGIKKLDNLLNQRASVLAQKTHASGMTLRAMRKAYNRNAKMFDAMSDLAIEASDAEVDILSPTPPASAKKQADYKRLRAKFLNLEKSHPDIANSYKLMREAYKRDIEEYLTAVKDIAGESIANQIRNDYAARGLEGYIPFVRFGDYVLEFEDPKDGQRNVMQFESDSDRRKFIQSDLAPRNIDYLLHKRINDVSYDARRAAPNTLLTRLMQEMEANQATKEQLDAIYQLQLSLMPSSSIAKRAMHRKNVKGMSRDLIRGFANVQTQWDRRLAATKFDAQIRNQIEEIRSIGEKSPDDLLHAAGDSIVGRAAFMLNPVHGSMTNLASALSYHLYMAGNLSSAFVNTSVLPLMVWPKLGAEFGFDKAFSAMNAVKGKALGDWGKEAKYSKLYATLVDRNQLINSLDREIIEARDIATKDHTGIMSAVIHLTSIPFLESEKYNRALTAMAAYDLARGKGMKEEEAVEYAVRTVEDIHTSGTAATSAKMFQHDFGRMFLTFKTFAWNSAYVTGRAWAIAARNAKNMQQAEGESDQQFAKRKADMQEAITQSRRQLLGMYGMAFAFGGIKGLPFYGGLSVLAAAIHAIAGDDDEPWDLEHELEQFLGTTATNGIVNEVTNLQIGQRTSIVNDLLYRDNPRAVADLGYAGAAAVSLLGPMGSYLVSIENSYNMFRQGHIERAIEGVVPSSARNIMKGMRYASEGAVTLKGDPVDKDISAYSALMQVVGFAPADLSNLQERKAMAKAYEKGVTEKRTGLLNKYNMALEAGDKEILDETMEEIDAFNKAIPQDPIRGKNLKSSRAHRRANQRKMLYGMTFNNKLRSHIQEEYFSDIEDEE